MNSIVIQAFSDELQKIAAPAHMKAKGLARVKQLLTGSRIKGGIDSPLFQQERHLFDKMVEPSISYRRADKLYKVRSARSRDFINEHRKVLAARVGAGTAAAAGLIGAGLAAHKAHKKHTDSSAEHE